MPQPQPQPWSPLDEYLWHTCDILADVLSGTLSRRPLLATHAPVAARDRVLAVGPANRLTWRAYGNGSYTHNQVVAFGSPAFVAGSLLGNALGNSSRRRQAERNAQPRWAMEGTGELTITLHKAYINSPSTSIHTEIFWAGLSSIDLVAPDTVETRFINNQGQLMTIRLQTLWASLIFVLAALNTFPHHPRLLTCGWLPSGFEQRCTAAGRPCRPAAELVLNRGTL
ncbi:hypothetical protein [Streptomyces gardneri]|uniref:hypothetical protein n=1 Tax=Streptomyces gardneri TaxID=66892 RepID=UPI0035D8BDFD